MKWVAVVEVGTLVLFGMEMPRMLEADAWEGEAVIIELTTEVVTGTRR